MCRALAGTPGGAKFSSTMTPLSPPTKLALGQRIRRWALLHEVRLGAAVLIAIVCLAEIDCTFPVAGPRVHGTITGILPFGNGRRGMHTQIAVTLDSGRVVLLPDNIEYRPGATVSLREYRSAILHRTGYAFERFE
jgi:hypothetical protein